MKDMHITTDPENTSHIKYIPSVIERTICTRHNKGGGGPCYVLELSNGDLALGVCDHRARAAGFVGRVSDKSMQRKRYESAAS